MHINVHCTCGYTLLHSWQTLPRLRQPSFPENLDVDDSAQRTMHSAKCNRRCTSAGSNWCRTCMLYGCQRNSNFVILLKLKEEISIGFRRALTRGVSSSNALTAVIFSSTRIVLRLPEFSLLSLKLIARRLNIFVEIT